MISGRRAAGELPQSADLPRSQAIMCLPRHPLALAPGLAAIFAPLMIVINLALLRIYGLHSLALGQFVLRKIVYACVLSSWIIDFAIFRLIQEDCDDGSTTSPDALPLIKNPMPKIGWGINFIRGMVLDFGINITLGLLFGGTVTHGFEVILKPIPMREVPFIITGVITGFIIAFSVVLAIAAVA